MKRKITILILSVAALMTFCGFYAPFCSPRDVAEVINRIPQRAAFNLPGYGQHKFASDGQIVSLRFLSLRVNTQENIVCTLNGSDIWVGSKENPITAPVNITVPYRRGDVIACFLNGEAVVEIIKQ